MGWETIWRSAPLEYGTTIGCLDHIRIRTAIRINARTERVRVLFSNRYGAEDMEIGKVKLSVIHESSPEVVVSAGGTWTEADPETGKKQLVRFLGRDRICIPKKRTIESDPVDAVADPGDVLVVDEFFDRRTPVSSVCMTWSDKSWSSSLPKKDQKTCFSFLADDPYEKKVTVGICGLKAEGRNPGGTIWLWGDSITHMGYYADALSDRLIRDCPGRTSILNFGLNGNRLLRDAPFDPSIPGRGAVYGKAGIRRFRQMAAGAGQEMPDALFFLEGANDCLLGYRYGERDLPELREFICAYSEVRKICAKVGTELFIGTLPRLHVSGEIWGKQAEELRSAVNAWIRKNFAAEQIVDVDRIMADPGEPERSNPDLCLADGLHPNAQGGRKIADGLYAAMKAKGLLS